VSQSASAPSPWCHRSPSATEMYPLPRASTPASMAQRRATEAVAGAEAWRLAAGGHLTQMAEPDWLISVREVPGWLRMAGASLSGSDPPGSTDALRPTTPIRVLRTNSTEKNPTGYYSTNNIIWQRSFRIFIYFKVANNKECIGVYHKWLGVLRTRMLSCNRKLHEKCHETFYIQFHVRFTVKL